MTTDIRDGAGRRTVAGGLLFAGVALAALLGSGTGAYAQETTTTTAPAATAQSTTAAGDTASTGSAPADTSTAAAPQDSSSGTSSSTGATAPATTSSEQTAASTPTYGPSQSARMSMEAKAAARKANKANAPAAPAEPAPEAAAAPAIQTDDGGGNGPLIPIMQTVTIGSDGTAYANTGANSVMGNRVLINGPANQRVRLFGIFRGPITITAVNNQTVTNNMIGSASATTGDANSTGATTTTGVTQTIGQGGSSGGGGAATGQTAAVTNTGDARANTGGNTVIGNDVTINAPSVQVVRNHGPPPGRIGTITLINDQDVRNDLNGRATATTGDATATGLVANTNVGQGQGGSGVGGGTQNATVTNVGNASANTGNNTVIGNNVVINVPVNQTVRLFGNFRGAITITMVNNQSIENNLTGDASLVTGNANASGVLATTDLAQSSGSGVGGGAQSASVTNVGTASANTGNNTVIGNNLIINMPVTQKVRFFGIFRGDISITLVNNQTIVNNLVGSASLVTGNATATGVIASTNISQAMGPDSDGTSGTVRRAKRQGHGGAAARARARGARHGNTGNELPRTGGSLEVMTLAGLFMIALGGLARRSVRTE
jgi:hypothetical protein